MRARGRLVAAVLAACAAASAAAADGAFNGGALSPLWIVPFAGILVSIARRPGNRARRSGITTSARRARSGRSRSSFRSRSTTASTSRCAKSCTRCSPSTCRSSSCCSRCSRCPAASTSAATCTARRGSTPALLALGTVLASIMGTTGAAMLLIRPLLRANDNRRHRAHVVVFFIFLVANIGGALTPLGDPPLFLGFLKGVDFFWTTKAMLWPTLIAQRDAARACSTSSTAGSGGARTRRGPRRAIPTPDSPIRIEGKVNFLLLVAIMACVLVSGMWKPGPRDRSLAGTTARTAERRARRRAARDRVGVVAAHAASGTSRASLHVGSDRRGREALRRHLPHHHSGDRDAARGQRRRARAAGRARHGRGRAPERRDSTSGSPARCRRSSTTRRPTSCSSISRAAMRRCSWGRSRRRWRRSRPAPSSWAPTPTSATRRTSWSRRSPRRAGVRMPSFFAYLGWALLVLTPIYALLTVVFFL